MALIQPPTRLLLKIPLVHYILCIPGVLIVLADPLKPVRTGNFTGTLKLLVHYSSHRGWEHTSAQLEACCMIKTTTRPRYSILDPFAGESCARGGTRLGCPVPAPFRGRVYFWEPSHSSSGCSPSTRNSQSPFSIEFYPVVLVRRDLSCVPFVFDERYTRWWYYTIIILSIVLYMYITP